jgi:hypothetical protein
MYIMWFFVNKNNVDNNYNYARYNDNSDSPIIYVGYLLLGLLLLAVLL